MVNNHGDRKSPIPGVMGPLPNGYSWLVNDGDPNYFSVLACEMTGSTGHQPG